MRFYRTNIPQEIILDVVRKYIIMMVHNDSSLPEFADNVLNIALVCHLFLDETIKTLRCEDLYLKREEAHQRCGDSEPLWHRSHQTIVRTLQRASKSQGWEYWALYNTRIVMRALAESMSTVNT